MICGSFGEVDDKERIEQMKRMAGLILGLFLAGCTFGVQNMESLMKDPHYAQHRQALDDLEHAYLQKQISYIEYEQKKKELENKYVTEVKMREEKMHE